MKGPSTAATFAVLLAVFAVVMFALIYSYNPSRDEAQKEVSVMQSSGVRDPGCFCSFVASTGKRFGSPDGTPARGFNELNGWVAAWGPLDPPATCACAGVKIALMPGISTSYTVELNNVRIGTLTVSDTVSVSITEPMPDFMQVARIWLMPGGYVLYDNGPRPAVTLSPGTYQVYATLRAAPRSDIYGRTADLTIDCGNAPTVTIRLRVPNPNEWGLRADIYRFTSPPQWPPWGAGYTYKGTWSVGAVYLWSDGIPDPTNIRSPYFTAYTTSEIPPKWVAYWIGTPYTYWAIRYTGNLYVPWSNFRVGFLHDDNVYIRLCSINPSNWLPEGSPKFSRLSGTCTAPGTYSIEIGYTQWYAAISEIFVIGPGDGNEAYIPTIDGAWYCPNFNWRPGYYYYGGGGRCYVTWSFVPASPSVPHFRGTNYTPSSTVDGGGTPGP